MKKESSSKFELIIRPRAVIKSRQWWNLKLKTFKKVLVKFSPAKKIKLSTKYSLTLLLTNNKEIKSLNKKFRKINKATDVLSFEPVHSNQLFKNYLGDIVISIQTAKKEAKKKQINLETELLTLFIHGYLHLLGYDHVHKSDAKIMFSLQNKLLKEIKDP